MLVFPLLSFQFKFYFIKIIKPFLTSIYWHFIKFTFFMIIFKFQLSKAILFLLQFILVLILFFEGFITIFFSVLCLHYSLIFFNFISPLFIFLNLYSIIFCYFNLLFSLRLIFFKQQEDQFIIPNLK
jgi:hypothetical protein